MSKDQSDSDPFPFRQVDRALKPKLPLLAGLMQKAASDPAHVVTSQHALGSLIEFWDLCADPRELQRIAQEAVAKNKKPEVVLPQDYVEDLFETASGYRVPARKFVPLGFLEPRDGNLFRVRGMSRDFKTIVERLISIENGKRGGQRSAEVRRAANGTAQPKGGKGSRNPTVEGSAGGQPPSEAPTEPPPKGHRSADRSAAEAEPNPRGQRAEGRVLASSSVDDDGPAAPPSLGLAFFEKFQAARLAHNWAPEDAPPREDLDGFIDHVAAKLRDTREGAVTALEQATKGYAKDPHWADRALPWAGFVAQWHRHVRLPPPTSTVSGCVVQGCEVVPAAGWPDEGGPMCYGHFGEALEWCAANDVTPFGEGAGWRKWLEQRGQP